MAKANAAAATLTVLTNKEWRASRSRRAATRNRDLGRLLPTAAKRLKEGDLVGGHLGVRLGELRL